MSIVLSLALLINPAWEDGDEPPSIGDLIAEANSYVQSSPSWTPAEASEEAPPAPDEEIIEEAPPAPEEGIIEETSPASEEGIIDEVDPEASILPDAEGSEAAPFALNSVIYYGSISTTILDLFAGIVGKYPAKDYVIFRSGQYTYDLFIGNITLQGIFTGTDLLHVVYDSNTSYTSGPYLRYNRESLQLTPGNGLVYSNLGDYPALAGVEVSYGKAYLFVGAAVFLFLLFKFAFGRSR